MIRVEYIGAAFDGSGYGEAARGYIHALFEAGCGITIRQVSFEQRRPDLGEFGAWMTTLLAPNHDVGADVRVIHTTPDTWGALLASVPPGPRVPTVGYCAWETSSPPAGWAEAINANVCMLLVPSNDNVESFRKAGVVVPIHKLPHAVRDVPARKVPVLPRDDRFRFLSIFQWTERKNPLGLLKAYLSEFRAGEAVTLVLKTYLLHGGPEEREQLKHFVGEVKRGLWLDSYPRVELIVNQLSGDDLRQLIHDCDCYVSLHRQEGFGLPIAEAMMAGKPVVASKAGGPADFGLPFSCGVDYQPTPVFGMVWPHYHGHMTWGEPALMQAREKMRTFFNDRAEAARIGEACRKAAQDSFDPKRIGDNMVALLSMAR